MDKEVQSQTCAQNDLMREVATAEFWSCNENGDPKEFFSADIGSVEWGGFICDSCHDSFDNWEEALAHVSETRS